MKPSPSKWRTTKALGLTTGRYNRPLHLLQTVETVVTRLLSDSDKSKRARWMAAIHICQGHRWWEVLLKAFPSYCC
ncbi:hypothetical protein VTN31DRAFT_2927 [Thermomyces dupontii]|uniref:uncharacterized protein n=1 Tax=Talaromyces thermophilus TaxID=28565 RepID=UPI00374348F2